MIHHQPVLSTGVKGPEEESVREYPRGGSNEKVEGGIDDEDLVRAIR